MNEWVAFFYFILFRKSIVKENVCTNGNKFVLLWSLQVPQPVVEGPSAMPSARAASKQFVQCTKCGRTNAAEARFCDWCGTKVSERCLSLQYDILTGLPSNLRQTTRKCVHLVMRVHFWSHDKDGSSIQHTRKPHAARKHHGSVLHRTAVIADRSFTLQE